MNPSAAQLRIDDQRLWQSLMDLAAIGATPKGGVCRIALTPEDQQGRDLVVQWFRQAGLSVRVDEVGNVFGRLCVAGGFVGADDFFPGGAWHQCCRILERKSLARGLRSSGLPKKSSRLQSSTILPASMKMTR